MCQALRTHHVPSSSQPTTLVADLRKRHPERLSNSPPLAQRCGMPPSTGKTGRPVCGVRAAAFGNLPSPTWLSGLLSRCSFSSGFYRPEGQLVKHQTLSWWRGAGGESEAAGRLGTMSLPFDRKGQVCQTPPKSEPAKMVLRWSLDPQRARGSRETDPQKREVPFKGQTTQELRSGDGDAVSQGD